MTSDRDRDASGRPRNARARDATGRPLDRSDNDGRGDADDTAALPPTEALRRAEQLFSAGLPFAAHEVLEDVWHASDGAERNLWQGLAQLAVGLTHAQRGNATGAVALLRRAADRLAEVSTPAPHDIAVEHLVATARQLAEAVERQGVDAVLPVPALRLRT